MPNHNKIIFTSFTKFPACTAEFTLMTYSRKVNIFFRNVYNKQNNHNKKNVIMRSTKKYPCQKSLTTLVTMPSLLLPHPPPPPTPRKVRYHKCATPSMSERMQPRLKYKRTQRICNLQTSRRSRESLEKLKSEKCLRLSQGGHMDSSSVGGGKVLKVLKIA